MKSKPRRALGGKGLLSHSISVQSLKNPYLKSLERRGRKKGREREGRQEEGRLCSCATGKEKESQSERG